MHDYLLKQQHELLRRRGYAVVIDADHGVAATLGLQQRFGHADLSMRGYPERYMLAALQQLAEEVAHGARYRPGRDYNDFCHLSRRLALHAVSALEALPGGSPLPGLSPGGSYLRVQLAPLTAPLSVTATAERRLG